MSSLQGSTFCTNVRRNAFCNSRANAGVARRYRSRVVLILLAIPKLLLLACQRSPTLRSLGNKSGVTAGALFMREPIIYFGIGVVLAALLFLGVKIFARSRLGRLAARRLEVTAPSIMADIEADMGELHAQIAVATRRLETSVEQMRSKTTTQLSEIGRSSEAIARLKAEFAERSIALTSLAAKETALHGQLRVTEAELSVKTAARGEASSRMTAVSARYSSGRGWRVLGPRCARRRTAAG